MTEQVARSGRTMVLPDAVAAGMPRLSSYADVDSALRSPLMLQVEHPRAAGLATGVRVDFPLAGSLQSLDGASHLLRRRAYAPLFRRAELALAEADYLVPALRRSLAGIRRSDTRGVPVPADLIPLMRSAALAVTVAMIGIDGADDPEGEAELLEISERLAEGGGVYWLNENHQRVITATVDARTRFMNRFGRPSVERRRHIAQDQAANLPAKRERGDLISVMLATGGVDLADELQLVNELTFFVVASFNTPTKLVPHVVVELDRWVLDHPAERGRLQDPTFVHMAAQEALRLHVAAPILLRRAADTVTLRSGRTVAAGTVVALDLGAANRDEAVFGEKTEEFRPGRTHAPNIPAYGLAFGSGQHKCIGWPLTIAPDAPIDDASPAGMMVRFILEFAAAGMRLDPTNPPRIRTDTVRDEFATCPVLFDSLDGRSGTDGR